MNDSSRDKEAVIAEAEKLLKPLPAEDSELPPALSYDRQEELLEPLNAMGAEYKIVGDGMRHYVRMQGRTSRVVVYPAMWSESSNLLPEGGIALADKLLKYASPKADEMIRAKIK